MRRSLAGREFCFPTSRARLETPSRALPPGERSIGLSQACKRQSPHGPRSPPDNHQNRDIRDCLAERSRHDDRRDVVHGYHTRRGGLYDRASYLEYLLQGDLPLTRLRLDDWLGGPSHLNCWGRSKSYSDAVPLEIFQQCILINQGRELLSEIHYWACGHHAAPQTLIGNAFKQGFYWPTMVADTTKIVRSCKGCQFYTKQTHLLA